MPTTDDLTILIGGEAGQGVESSSAGFAKALARGGFRVFVLFDYHSRIRGGHNFAKIRVSHEPLWTHREPVHLVLALTEETVRLHLDEVVSGGAIIYDEDLPVDAERLQARGVHPFPMPLVRIAREVGGTELMANTAALGAAAGVTGLDLAPMVSVIRDNFRKKGEAVVEGNRKVAEASRDLAQERYGPRFPWKLEGRERPPRMVLHGNQAFALGALLGGCKFVAGYPMTPGSPVLEWMAAHAARYGVLTKHVEDEIAALCMAIGAAHMGVRAMTPTSGGGFALMVEALGLAGMTEVPVVIYEAQRPGPSTGLATRTEQGDLLFPIFASQGDFPRIVLAPGTIEEAFEAGWRAFNLAERYQCPVIVLSDHALATSLRDVPPESLDFAAVTVDRGALLQEDDLDALEGEYLRHRITEDGVSPRAVPGHPKAVYSVVSDEHDERGHITEEARNRVRQMDKRMRKLEAARAEMRPPVRYGPEDADYTFLCWGSTYGPLREAVDLLNADGVRANLLHLVDVWPFPGEKVRSALGRAGKTVMVEGNHSGQMARLLRMETGYQVWAHIRKYDGRSFSPEYILAHFQEVRRHG
ncbi:MAG: 2-oxoacid:acceptor oxidoreductase subunit alpha [Anaerolineae bacterium]|nr:2-oxoacid:acceptor oxidoreductase subunit alpha [Anaerolineae bacterium]